MEKRENDGNNRFLLLSQVVFPFQGKVNQFSLYLNPLPDNKILD